MKYISTRGEAPTLSFNEAMLAGLARDGGLYLPECYPVLPRETIASFAGLSYGAVAKAVLLPFVGSDLDDATLDGMIAAAYGGFRHDAIAPLSQLGDNLFVLELFHGPTLAFKDLAMQLLARFMDHALKQRGQHATIVGATSGDTGAAAIEAFRGLANIDVVIFYPHGRVSDVQRRQMTSVPGDNIHVVALEGTFDDAPGHREVAVQPRRLPRRVRPFRRQLDQLGPGCWRRQSTTSPAPSRSARRIARSPTPCRRAISATFSPAGSPNAWACRSSVW